MMNFNNRLEQALFKAQQCFALFESRDNLLRSIAATIEELDISVMVIGGVALSNYNYNRATEDVDLVLSLDAANKLGDYLNDNNNFTFIGHNKFKHLSGIDINLCPSGTMAGHGKFPDVEDSSPGVRFVSLPLLLALKIQAKRLKDRGDFAELVKRNNLSLDYIKDNVFPLLSSIDQQWAINLWKKAVSE
jgi:hypothetical protein